MKSVNASGLLNVSLFVQNELYRAILKILTYDATNILTKASLFLVFVYKTELSFVVF